MPVIQVSGVVSDFQSPPRVANFVQTTVANDLMVLTFAFIDPSKVPNAGGSDTVTVEAKAFDQIAIPRSAFAGWLAQAVAMISGLPDRTSLGWDEIAKVVADAAAKNVKP